ncbi:MAG: transporter ATP-binding protein [Herbinix sp.]|jgi:ATP-binding cassette subfamily B protein|nr:transporter ATP-binding protein [Herbinix sp.]
MAEQLKKDKVYKTIDFIRIPFRICPVYSLLDVLNRIINALIPALQVVVTADFIDTALAVFKGQTQQREIYQPLIFLMFMVAYSYLNWNLMSYVNLKRDMRMTEIYRSEIVEKRARLEYCHIEDKNVWELINRTCSDPESKLMNGFSNVWDAASLII